MVSLHASTCMWDARAVERALDLLHAGSLEDFEQKLIHALMDAANGTSAARQRNSPHEGSIDAFGNSFIEQMRSALEE